MKMPKTLGQCADMLYALREKRQKIQAQADAIEADEKALKEHIIANLDKNDAKGITGLKAKASLSVSKVPTVKDWPALYEYVKKHDAFELLHRRVNDGAAREMWEAGKEIPGVEPFTVIKISLTKV